MAELSSGRRALAKNEHLFLTSARKKCKPHVWIKTSLGQSGEVVACSVCGRLRKGETLPSSWPVLAP